MFYYMFFIVVLIFFICINFKKSRQSLTFAVLLTVYLFSFFAMLLYLSKDGYYYNVLTQYFYLPNFMWKKLFFLRVSRFTVIRFLNLSNIGVVVSSVFFSLTMLGNIRAGTLARVRLITVFYALLLAVVYDPLINIESYYFLYPDFLSPAEYVSLTNLIHQGTKFLNISIILSTVIIISLACRALPKIHIIRMPAYTLAFCYLALCTCYCFFLSFAPAHFLRISKFARSHTFISIRLFNSPTIYNILPYFLLFFALWITYSLFRISKIHNQIDRQDLHISKQISAAETTSKVFCHYIKNEVLAIQTQIELLPEHDGEIKFALENTVKRCENLYNRIDAIHRSTKTTELQLKKSNLCECVEGLVEEFKGETENYNVEVFVPDHKINVLADEEYLRQAVHNLIRNALDAMEDLSRERKNLTLRIQEHDCWVILSVTDTGVGISKENLTNIFTPFFSSASFSKHWGIGLPLTYKILKAHDGKIEIQSTVGKGTEVRVILPALQNRLIKIGLMRKGIKWITR